MTFINMADVPQVVEGHSGNLLQLDLLIKSCEMEIKTGLRMTRAFSVTDRGRALFGTRSRTKTALLKELKALRAEFYSINNMVEPD